MRSDGGQAGPSLHATTQIPGCITVEGPAVWSSEHSQVFENESFLGKQIFLLFWLCLCLTLQPPPVTTHRWHLGTRFAAHRWSGDLLSDPSVIHLKLPLALPLSFPRVPQTS